MNLGTIAFNKNVYNLDFMSNEEMEELVELTEKEKVKLKKEIRKAFC